jgi:hypothetical protein
MEDKKKQELEKLYALRAGLSLISQNSDALDNDRKKMNEVRTTTYNNYEPVYKGMEKKDVDESISETLFEGERIQTGLSKMLVDTHKELKRDSRSALFFTRKCLPAVSEGIMDVIDNIIGDNFDILPIVTLIAFVLLFPPITIVLVAFDLIAFPFVLFSPKRIKKLFLYKAIAKDKHFKDIKYIARRGDDIDQMSMQVIKENLHNLKKTLDASDYKYTSLDKKLFARHNLLSATTIIKLKQIWGQICEIQRQEGYEEIERQKEEHKNECMEWRVQQDKRIENYNRNLTESKSLISRLCLESNAISDAMKSSYSSMLDMRDWENLDLIIYYYETGRADSIKEALQLVDVERRNNNLINCIQQASNEIYDSIKSGVQQLGTAMVQGFQFLSSQIEAQRTQLSSNITQLGNNMDKSLNKVSASIGGVVTQQALSNALLAKANVSSKEMVEQMKKLNLKVK